jgi:hypothetical protein
LLLFWNFQFSTLSFFCTVKTACRWCHSNFNHDVIFFLFSNQSINMIIDASGSRRKTLLHSSMTGMRIIFNYKVMLMRQLIHFIFQAFCHIIILVSKQIFLKKMELSNALNFTMWYREIIRVTCFIWIRFLQSYLFMLIG